MACFGKIEFNRLPCPNDKMYVAVIFADRLPFQLSMSEGCILIWQCQIRHAQIVHDTVISKTTTGNRHNV